MRSIFFFGLSLLFSALSAQTLWMVDPLEPIYPDTNVLKNYSESWTADFPQNGVPATHVVIRLKPGTALTLAAYIGNDILPPEVWSQLLPVPVEENTGLDSRTEQFTNQPNPHVIRKAPFRVFEVIKPLSSRRLIAEEAYTALRLTVPVELLEREKKPLIKVFIQGEGWDLQGEFRPQIHRVMLPELGNSRFFYTNWFNLAQMEAYHGLTRWDEAWYAMLEQYAKLMAYGRQTCIKIPEELIGYKDGAFFLEEEKMLRFIQVFQKYSFQYFESPHLLYRGEEDDWSTKELVVRHSRHGYYSPEGKKDIGELVRLIKRFTEKNRLTYQWLQHVADEPTAAQADCYQEIVQQIKSLYPEIKIMEATNEKELLVGAVDWWCPLINDFQENQSFFEVRSRLREKVLVYTCLIPGGPWLNRTLDMEKIRQVYFGWGALRYGTDGYLHWGLNQYRANPFIQSVVKHPSPAASANNYLPAGDTHIIYPGVDGPLSGLRFEAHRLGAEDYELLYRLKGRNAKLAETILTRQFRNYTDYNLSLNDYRKSRRKILSTLASK
ncbi:MAG: DUF4091 domain-containing protein [Bacteroidota bacterium]